MRAKKTFPIIILVALLLTAYFIMPARVIKVSKNFIQLIASPFERVAFSSSSKIGGFFSSIGEIKNLRQENEQLKEQVFALMTENSQLNNVNTENQLLRAEIEVKNTNGLSLNLLKVDIIAREPNTFFQSLTIDQGESSGVRVGQPAIYQGILVGRVTLVNKSSANVTLVISSRSIIQAMLSESRTLGIVKGGNQGLYLDNIPQDIPLKEGELVVTSGLGGDLPKGIVIGKVDKVTTAKSEIFQTFSLTTPLDFNNLESIFIVK